jgi:hypothetical protein
MYDGAMPVKNIVKAGARQNQGASIARNIASMKVRRYSAAMVKTNQFSVINERIFGIILIIVRHIIHIFFITTMFALSEDKVKMLGTYAHVVKRKKINVLSCDNIMCVLPCTDAQFSQ